MEVENARKTLEQADGLYFLLLADSIDAYGESAQDADGKLTRSYTMPHYRSDELRKVDRDFCKTMKSATDRWVNAVGWVIFANHDLSSSQVGRKFVAPFGPDNTLTECPSRDRKAPFVPEGYAHPWAYYPECWVSREDLRHVLDERLNMRG